MPQIPIRHPANVPGDFYSTVGCILCNAPATVAPTMIGFVGKGREEHCVVTKQPIGISEVKIMIEAMESSCVECYRYSGSDADIILLLTQRNLGHLCDDSA